MVYEHERKVVTAQYNAFFHYYRTAGEMAMEAVSLLRQNKRQRDQEQEWQMWSFTCMLVASVADPWCG